MFKTRENISFANFDAILVVIVIFFGVLIFANFSGKNIEPLKKPIASLTVVIENYAINPSLARVQIFQKTWVSNKDNFKLLTLSINQLSENRKTNIRVSQLLLIRQSLAFVPQFILRYHLFPREMDDPNFLS